MKNILCFFTVIQLFSLSSFASYDLYEFQNEENRARYTKLTKELRCPKCQNQDIADSNSPISSDMRREVHRLLEEGKQDNEIVAFMVERFGEFVSYKPKVQRNTYLLWYGPWILILLGAIMIFLMVKSRTSKKEAVSGSELEQTNHEREVDELLSQYKQDKDK